MKPDIEGVSIVLLGSFNPKIFHPMWFAAHKLIGQKEAENADIEIIHSDVAIFKLEWLQFQATRDRFSLVSSQPDFFDSIKDLMLSTFSILLHTPLRIMGINIDQHFRMPSEEEWHAIGHRLAPKNNWKDCLTNPGLKQLVMEGARPDDFPGRLHVRVESSRTVKPWGIFASVNDEYELQEARTCDQANNIVKQHWDKSLDRSRSIIQSIFKKD